MADLVITATQVLEGADSETDVGTAGETLTAGQPLYLNELDNMLYLADANVNSYTARVEGIALHGASVGQPVRYQNGGTITLGAGAAPVIGTLYVLSGTAGGIAPVGDLAVGWFRSLLGVGTTGNALLLIPGFFNSGVKA